MIKQTTAKKTTSDAIQILDKITGDDPQMHALIEEERTNLQVATEIFELRTKAKLSQEMIPRLPCSQRVMALSIPLRGPRDDL